MKSIAIISLSLLTACSYTKKDDHSVYYRVTQIKQEFPVQHERKMTDQDYAQQYVQNEPQRNPTPVVVYDNRQYRTNNYHTPIVYTPPYIQRSPFYIENQHHIAVIRPYGIQFCKPGY